MSTAEAAIESLNEHTAMWARAHATAVERLILSKLGGLPRQPTLWDRIRLRFMTVVDDRKGPVVRTYVAWRWDVRKPITDVLVHDDRMPFYSEKENPQ